MAVPADCSFEDTKKKKKTLLKDKDLEIEIPRMWHMKTSRILVMVGDLGLIGKCSDRITCLKYSSHPTYDYVYVKCICGCRCVGGTNKYVVENTIFDIRSLVKTQEETESKYMPKYLIHYFPVQSKLCAIIYTYYFGLI